MIVSHIQIQTCADLKSFEFKQRVSDVGYRERFPFDLFIQLSEVRDEAYRLVLLRDDGRWRLPLGIVYSSEYSNFTQALDLQHQGFLVFYRDRIRLAWYRFCLGIFQLNVMLNTFPFT